MRIRGVLAASLLLMLFACSKPVPPEKSAYVGEWKGPGMYLLVLRDGSVRYERLKNGGSVTVSGPLKEFKGNDFLVGVGPLSTTFVVSKPPFQNGNAWKMVVDGVELTKID